MRIIDNKIHLSDADYSAIARDIVADIEYYPDDGYNHKAKVSTSLHNDIACLEITLSIYVERNPYRPGDYYTPPEGGEVRSMKVDWVDYIEGWGEDEEVAVVFDRDKLNEVLN